MKNLNKSTDGMYHIKGGAKYSNLVGSRAQVWHGTAYKTSGGLTKTNLIKNKSGRIVSKNKHIQSSKEKRLLQYGYGYKKGKFVLSKKSKTKKFKGGNTEQLITESTESTESSLMPEKKSVSSSFFSSLSNIMGRFTGGKSRKRRGGGVADNAALFNGGGRSRRMRGGLNGASPNFGSDAAHVKESNSSGSSMSGGRKSRRSRRGRKSRGGTIYGQGSGSVASLAGKWDSSTMGLDASTQSLNSQVATSFSGGKRRSRKGRKMRGGMYGQNVAGGVASNAGSWKGNDTGPNLNLLATNY